MIALQMAIGALNDLVDAPADAGRVPPKPIPAQEVSVATARTVALVAAALGLGLAAVVDVRLVGLALVVLAIGAAYDLVAKGTPWSWLPFAVGIPILPIYGWFGATGTLPAFFVVLIPMAVLAGAALAVANARADLDADRAAAAASVATVLGPVRSWWLDAGLMAAATGVGVALVRRCQLGPCDMDPGGRRDCAGHPRARARARLDYARAAAFVGGPGGRCGGRRDRVGRGDDAGRVLVGRHGSIAVNPVSRVHQTGRARSRSPAAASRSSDTSRDCPGRRRRSN